MRYLLHDVFLNSVKQVPENVAITEEDGNLFTYAELNNLSNRFANCFSSYKKNIKKSPFIGIISSVHSYSIAAVLGTLKIGCAYIPLDEYSPTEKLKSILDNTELDILVVDSTWVEHHKSLFQHSTLKKIILLNHAEIQHSNPLIMPFEDLLLFSDEEPPLLNQVSDDLAYILHSSGSTGVPKGIMLTHRNARTFVDWMHKEFALTAQDVVMSRAPLKFDLSVFDIFNTFKSGARLVCYNWNRKRKDDQKHQDYVSLMAREKVTILYTTPSTFITLMNRGDLSKAPLSLSRLMYAGEPFPVPQLKRLQAILPQVKIANIYGPTETNIITYYWINELPEGVDAIPLGYVVEDTEILVVNEDEQRICEINELGALWCRGGTVTLGYLGMPEKSKECLVQSPFHAYPCHFWRTGDYGLRDTQGLLHYRGRRDHMVKVKGYRIELGEIESALAQFEGLDEFAVVATPHPEYGNELFCFFSKIRSPFLSFSSNDVKNFVSTKISNYKIPSKFIELQTLPKTSSDKIDRVLLAEEAKKQKVGV
jgi:amino acid adenylation domain-containing protein